MDLITQGLLGAAIGQAFFTRRLGRQAVTIGAIMGLLPDADVFCKYLADPMADLKYHRWITHSFWFGILLSPPIAYLLAKMISIRDQSATFHERFKLWFWLLFWALFTHPLLDLFTVYGTQFFAPFSIARFHWNAIAIVDFGYSILLIVALIMGWFYDYKQQWQRGERWARIALVLSTLYLGAGLAMDNYVSRYAKQLMPNHTVKAHPTLAQLFYRKIYAYHPHETCVGFYTIFKPHSLHFQCRDRQFDRGIAALLETDIAKTFVWFTDDEYWVERDLNDPTIVRIHDLRFTRPQTPFQGSWGIEAHVSQNGKLLDTPRRCSFKNKPISIAQLWQMIIPPAFGLDP